ncbi:DNA repair exonuclease [Brevibacillus humidisoli]|uniref:metallophosphoesterase family protein n=1 Tax=Brevibacillus humidisoli TaxID=2895522 RepID=UPI001E29F985|nr:DNA repair exonuclease [Brevibacillus humidisoli]UFJ39691.1 DNA repair exonuclease [Brevibacillus humidisoli]
MISFIHMADVHLDAPLKSLSEKYELRQQDFRQTMKRVRDLVLSRQVDYWLIAGDLLEYHGGTRATASFLQDLFASVAPVPVCIAPGNHDPWLEDSFYRTLEWSSNVIFFTPEWGAYEFPEKSCVVYGWGFPQTHVSQSPMQDFPGKLPGYQNHLMVLHATVGEDGDHHPYAPVSLAELAQTGVDYAALGHIHKPRTYLHPHTGSPFAAYPGTPEGLTVKESDERHVLYGQLDETGRVALEAISVQSRRIRKVEVELQGAESMEAIFKRVETALASEHQDDLLFIELVGERASHLVPSLDLLYAQYGSYFFVRFEDKSWPDLDEQQLLQQGGILARWLEKLAEQAERSDDPRERLIAQTARREALRQIGGMLR